MVLKYDIDIDRDIIINNIDRLTNQVFKLLPYREENNNWKSPLENIILELTGMSRLLGDQLIFFQLLCKLEGLFTLTGENDFLIFRKTIFECLGLMNRLKECL